MLPSLSDIQNHREVVWFPVGLMSDPTPLVDHVYQMLIDDGLKEMKAEYHSSSLYDTDLLKSLYTESQVQLPGHPLHNRHINYYNHNEDDYRRRPRDTTAIYFPSKVYEFIDIENDIVLGTKHREQETEIPECTLIINDPDKDVVQCLLSNCQVIMRNQAINYLSMDRVTCTDVPQTFVFNISKHIQSLTLNWCHFPSQTLKHLLEQINECTALRKINLGFTSLKYVWSLTLRNKTSLTHLDLGCTWMSRELSRSVCHQLSDLTQLEYLDLSLNDLSLVDIIHLSNKPNLSYLYCHRMQMSTNLCKNLIGQVGYITHLSKLDLSHNTLTGCLSSFLPDPHPGLPELWRLNLRNTALNKGDLQYLLSIAYKLPKLQKLDLSDYILTGCLSCFLPDPQPGLPELDELNLERTALNNEDLQHLTHIIQTHKLPGLDNLYLYGNRLCEMETDVDHLIEACVTHHQRELTLSMWDNDLSDAFREKWKQRCAGTNIELGF